MNENEKNKKTYSKTKVFLVSVVVLVSILFAATYYFLPLFNSNKEMFVESTSDIKNNIEIEQQIQTISSESKKTTSNLKECGDGKCGIDETYSTCPLDCAPTCGDGIVQDNENWRNCRYDLLYTCGNGICEEWEHYRYCSQDCSECVVDDDNKYTGEDKCPPSPRWAQ